MNPLRSLLHRLARLNIQTWRKIVQCLFVTVTILIGIQFGIFVSQLEKGMLPTISRPPGIEAFLPISSLISLKYWIVSGVFNRVHPAGLMILLWVLTTAMLLKRGFCSWVCPFGLLTEYLNRVHHYLFKKDVILPRGLDYPLRSLKYLLLTFFLWAILIKMNAIALEYFIYSPYNMVADIKMLYFFSNISWLAFWILVMLLVLSIFIRNFWCRYLCPYGALLGVLSVLSIFKIHRNEDTCTRCQKCTRICPVDIAVHSACGVYADECHACLKCVAVCPEKDTLYVSAFQKKGVMKPVLYAAVITLLFIGGPTLGRITGYWHNSISNQEYVFHVAHLNLSFYQHNRGQVPTYNRNAWLQKRQKIRAVQGGERQVDFEN